MKKQNGLSKKKKANRILMDTTLSQQQTYQETLIDFWPKALSSSQGDLFLADSVNAVDFFLPD